MVMDVNNKTVANRSKTGRSTPVLVSRWNYRSPPDISYQKIKDALLGQEYSLSIAFVDTKTATELHLKFKKLPGPVNVLSFPYSKTDGEIIAHLETIRGNASAFGRSYHNHLIALLIHSMLHLLGHTHGSTMERLEKRWCEHFCASS